jgi:uncharacterized protein (TIGR02594 family)
MSVTTLRIQQALKAQGFDPGPLDGVNGSLTEAAIIRFKVANGLKARPYLGPVTLQLLFGSLFSAAVLVEVPWVNEFNKHMDLHEIRDNAELVAWLRSDGRTVGDPARIPWCADAMETAIKIALPNEPFIGKVKANPYYALNWLDFGDPTEACYGAIAVFWRNGGGHIGNLVGIDPSGGKLRIRGGNQGNVVCDTWIAANRLKGYRWPKTYDGAKLPVPIMNSNGAVISTNEA